MRPNKDATKPRDRLGGPKSTAMSKMLDSIGRLIARYLEKPVRGYEPFTPSDPDALRQSLAARRRAPGRGQQPHCRRHQISHPIDLVAFGALCRTDRGPVHCRRRAACSDRSQSRRRRGFGAAVEIFPLPHPHLPAGRTDRGGLRHGVRLCHRPRRLRLRPQEHHRPVALSVAAAGAAALAPAHDRARLGRSVAADLLGADRRCVHRRALSDPAQDHAGAQPPGAGADFGNPPLLAVLPARLRHFALFQRGQADHPPGLRLQGAAMGRSAPCARRRIARVATRGRRTPAPWRPDRVPTATCACRRRVATSAVLQGRNARRRHQCPHADVRAAAARGVVEIGRAGAGADRRRRHRARPADPLAGRAPAQPRSRPRSGRTRTGRRARWPGCSRSPPASASSSAASS